MPSAGFARAVAQPRAAAPPRFWAQYESGKVFARRQSFYDAFFMVLNGASAWRSHPLPPGLCPQPKPSRRADGGERALLRAALALQHADELHGWALCRCDCVPVQAAGPNVVIRPRTAVRPLVLQARQPCPRPARPFSALPQPGGL